VRILIWSPNYWPEPIGISPLVTDAAEWCVARGHEVDVVTAVPNYPKRRIVPCYRGAVWQSERIRGVNVHRSWLRVRPQERILDKLLYESSFTALSAPRVLRRLVGSDVLVCVVPSLSAAVCAAALARALRAVRRSVRLVFWVQDLVLDAAVVVQGAPRISRLLGVARSAEVNALRAADCVVVCSPGFATYFASAGVPSVRLATVANWVDVDRIRPSPPPNGNGKARFLYAGNVGYSQGFETLVDAARLAGDGVEVRIVGDGNASARVRELSEGLPNVAVCEPVAEGQFPQLLAAADVHVVLQRRAVAGANLPSKIGPYLASGRPVVASLDLDTPAAELLRDSGGALLVPPEDPVRLADAMQELGRRPELRRQLADSGRSFAVEHLDRRVSLPRFEAAVVG
jgi:colanic acid biosynthesis glycosyl transferase WcaI